MMEITPPSEEVEVFSGSFATVNEGNFHYTTMERQDYVYDYAFAQTVTREDCQR